MSKHSTEDRKRVKSDSDSDSTSALSNGDGDSDLDGLEDEFAGQLDLTSGHYELKRTDSGMTAYTEMLDEILNDDLADGEIDVGKSYEKVVVKKPSLEKAVAQAELESMKSAHKKLTKSEKKDRKAKYLKSKKDKTAQIKTMKDGDEEAEYDSDLEKRRTHFFRGKNLTSTLIDPETKKQRLRTREEVREYITKKFRGRPVYSDGVATIVDDAAKQEEVRKKVKEYFDDVISGNETTSLFNAGNRYSSAVRDLMKLTGLKGNPVVATSKFPWVAAEYSVGQMGGASGGGRGTALGDDESERPVGYDKDKRPVNRVLANNFIISMSMKEYRQLRDDGDLIDVNLDVAKGIGPNQVIEEVTFNSKVNGDHVLGSLPMVLPRFDRDYDTMSEDKKKQYHKIFGLDKVTYEKLQKKFKDDNVTIGAITEHLIRHHGNLMRAIAVNLDRKAGHKGKFVVPYSESYQGYVDDMASPAGSRLASRSARTGSASKSGSYVEDDGSVTSQIKRVKDPKRSYADDEFNSLMESQIAQDTYYAPPTVVAAGHLNEAIEEFLKGGRAQAVIGIHDENHFTAIRIEKDADSGFVTAITYFDPVVSLEGGVIHRIPAHVAGVLEEKFPDVEIVDARSTIQTYTTLSDESILIDNNHCGAFVCCIMSEMTKGNVRINPGSKKLEVKISDDDWCEIDGLSKSQSDEFGKEIRDFHSRFLRGDEILDAENQETILKNFVAGLRGETIVVEAETETKPTPRILLREFERVDKSPQRGKKK